MKQRTIRSEISCQGVGLHTGKAISLKLTPAPANSGVVFRRVDLNPIVSIPALYNHVGDTRLSTCLCKDDVRISTIEHLMSAVFALGIDNLIIDVDAAEVPIMDGSSAPFLFLLQSAGIAELKQKKQFIYVRETIEVEGPNGEKACFKPASELSYHISMDFNHPHKTFSQKNQSIDFKLSSHSYQSSISRARTFGFLEQYEMLKSKGLVQGGSLDNAIVFDAFTMVNKDPLRFEDEPLRHKLLDVIGDLALTPATIIGAFEGHKTGHTINNALLRKLMLTHSAWESKSADALQKAPVCYLSPAVIT